MSTLEIVPAGTYDFAEAQDLMDVWRSEGGDNFQPTFHRIKVPGAGGKTWEIDDEHAPTQALRGVVVAWTASTALYLKNFDDRGEDESGRPDAYSNDGVVQVIPPETYQKIAELNAARQAAGQLLLPNPETDLSKCPYNRFGSIEQPTPLGKASGKDTNEYRNIYLVLEDSETPAPYHLQLPATSIKHWDGREGYAKGLLSKGIRLSSRVTEFTLHPIKAGAVSYSEVHAQSVGRLSPEAQNGFASDKQIAQAYAEEIGRYVKRDPFQRAVEAAPAQAQLAASPVVATGVTVNSSAASLLDQAFAAAPVVDEIPEPAQADPVDEPQVQEPVAAGASAGDIDF